MTYLTICEEKRFIRHDAGEIVMEYERDGVPYKVTSNHKVLIGVPSQNVLDGTKSDIYVTPGIYYEITRPCRDPRNPPPDPRLDTIHEVGWRKNPKKITGFTSAASSISVMWDKGGGVWWGASDYAFTSFHVKRNPSTTYDKPEITLLYPALTYLGQDTKESRLWLPNWNQTESSAIVLCTYEVRRVIESARIWGHYFPHGKARYDLEIAKREVDAVAKSTLNHLEAEAARATKLHAQLEASEKDCLQLQRALEQKTKECTALFAELSKLKAQGSLGEWQERAERAERILEEARIANKGWDWTQL